MKRKMTFGSIASLLSSDIEEGEAFLFIEEIGVSVSCRDMDLNNNKTAAKKKSNKIDFMKEMLDELRVLGLTDSELESIIKEFYPNRDRIRAVAKDKHTQAVFSGELVVSRVQKRD